MRVVEAGEDGGRPPPSLCRALARARCCRRRHRGGQQWSERRGGSDTTGPTCAGAPPSLLVSSPAPPGTPTACQWLSTPPSMVGAALLSASFTSESASEGAWAGDAVRKYFALLPYATGGSHVLTGERESGSLNFDKSRQEYKDDTRPTSRAPAAAAASAPRAMATAPALMEPSAEARPVVGRSAWRRPRWTPAPAACCRGVPRLRRPSAPWRARRAGWPPPRPSSCRPASTAPSRDQGGARRALSRVADCGVRDRVLRDRAPLRQALQLGWDYWTAFYFSSVTFTTVGFGDFVTWTARRCSTPGRSSGTSSSSSMAWLPWRA